MTSVSELIVSGTTMTEVDENDMNLCPNLVKLALNNNRILVVQQHAFKSLNKLQDLDISGNFIARLPGPSLIGLHSLRTFNLSRNRLNLLDIFPKDLFDLKILDLSFNEIGKDGNGFLGGLCFYGSILESELGNDGVIFGYRIPILV